MQNAVLGSPISHSKSPQIHLAAYHELGLDWKYERFEVSEPGFNDFLEANARLSGLSLTMPLKEAGYEWALGHGAAIDEPSMLLKASNTLRIVQSGVQAFNTDVFGVRQAMVEAEVETPSTLAILGSGATSRSVMLGLLQAFDHLGSISVFARNRESAGNLIDLANAFSSQFDDIQWLPLEAAADFGGADLTCNTLPAGVADSLEVDVPINGGWLFDVAYNPWPSTLSLGWASEMTISGLEMLLWQALGQVRAFVSGDPQKPLPNEGHVFSAMRKAAGDI